MSWLNNEEFYELIELAILEIHYFKNRNNQKFDELYPKNGFPLFYYAPASFLFGIAVHFVA
ncbi:MAG: hypothetical protein ACRBBN_10615 [Methyloligellaceae bacterium]